MSGHPGINLGESHGAANDQAEVLLFGFWVFMMSDAVIFGLLFATYVVMLNGMAGGPGPQELFELRPAFIETMILLTSSLTMGMASLAMKEGRSNAVLLVWLGVTLALGLAFLGFELSDFVSMVQKGGVPTRSGWLSSFWALVPLHGLHVTAASLWLIVIGAQVLIYGQDAAMKTAMLRLGVLWHFLDIVWIGIFSVVYLGGLA
ncbi:cytochrome c oxidase subunit 3 [Pseudoroseicyclus sp. H15]